MTPTPRARRWPKRLAVLGVLLIFGAWWVNRELEPHRLTALVLGKLGESTGLDLRFSGDPDYAFRPEPRLLIPHLEVRGASDGKIFLQAERAQVSLPWTTVTGGEPVITRIELDHPVLDWPGLRRWQATLPRTPFKLPTLTKGLAIRAGRLIDEGYAVSDLVLDLPRLKSGEPAQLAASGRFDAGTERIDFQAKAMLATPGLDSDFQIDANGHYLQDKPLPYRLQASGHYLSDAPGLHVDFKQFELTAASPLPSLKGQATLALTTQLQFDMSAILKDWPRDWPALPEPLAKDSANLPLHLSYRGRSDLSDPLGLQVQKGATHLQAQLRVADMQHWLAQSDAPPLPPLNATLDTPTIELNGVKLNGVKIVIDDGAPAHE